MKDLSSCNPSIRRFFATMISTIALLSAAATAEFPSDSPRLTSLAIKSGSGPVGFTNTDLSPAFDPETFSYNVTIPFEHNAIEYDTNNTMPASGSIVIPGELPAEIPAGGSAQFVVSAVSENAGPGGSEIAEYTITISRTDPDSSSALSSLIVSNADLTPNFVSGILSYGASVPNDISSITITPTVVTDGATVSVNGEVVSSGTSSNAITLPDEGESTITVLVTAPGTGNIRPYTLNVTRLGADSDDDGIPDLYEIANGLSVGVLDGDLDLDGDGLRNISEYAFGSDPNDSNSHNDPIVTLDDDGFLMISFHRAIDPGNLFYYEVQISSDLQTWLPDLTNQTDPETPKTQVWKDHFGGSPTPPTQRFVRVRFSSSL